MLCTQKLRLRVNDFPNYLTCMWTQLSLRSGPAGSQAYATRDDGATGKIMTTSAFSNIYLIS